MHIKSFLLMIVFSLLPYTPFGFVPSQAYAFAHCCMCGQCNWWCKCPGTWPCRSCAAPNPDPETVKSTNLTEHISADLDIRGVRASVLSSATERMVSDMAWNNGRKVISRRLFENLVSELKPWCPQNVHDKKIPGNALGIQAKADQIPQ